MAARTDRAVSELVGAVILFAFLVLLVALWQAQVVPQQNYAVEFNHNQAVHGDLLDVRNAVVSAARGGDVPSVSVDMAPVYPSRTLFLNPARPVASLRTVGTTDPAVAVTVQNGVVRDPDVGDFWNGSGRTYRTGSLVYEPGYNAYTGAPVTHYENTVLYNRHGTVDITLAGQRVVRDDTITLVGVNGSLNRNAAQSQALDIEPLSTSTRTVAVTNASGGNVTLVLPTALNATQWRGAFAETGELADQGGNVVDVRSAGTAGTFELVAVELRGGETYTLRMAKIGVGAGATAPDPTYLVGVEGDNRTISTEATQTLVVEVRDAFNNPVAGVTVENGSGTDLRGGSLDAEAKETGAEGRASFRYTPGTAGTAVVELEMGDGTAERVAFAVDVIDPGDVPPSLTSLVVTATSEPCSDPDGCYDTVSFEYAVADDTEVSEIVVQITDQDGDVIQTETEVVNADTASGTVQVDISGTDVPVGAEPRYELVVVDESGHTETDTGIVPSP